MKSAIPRRLLLFDIDGTLIDSGGAGVEALRRVLREHYGATGNLDGIEVAGRTDSGIVEQILRKENMAITPEATAEFLELYADFLAAELPRRQGRILPGVTDLLRDLVEKRQHVLGLLTGNIERGARLKLRHYGLWDLFEFGAFADDHHDRNQLGPFAQRRAREKHAIDFKPEEIDVIGDTPHDIACGRAIGARTVAVATGKFSRKDLESHQPDFLFEDFSDPERLMEELGW